MQQHIDLDDGWEVSRFGTAGFVPHPVVSLTATFFAVVVAPHVILTVSAHRIGKQASCRDECRSNAYISPRVSDSFRE